MSTKATKTIEVSFPKQAFFNILLVIVFLCVNLIPGFAQNQSGGSVSFLTGSTYIGAYNIKCNGDNTGSLDANPTFGTAPYTFLWNTGETVANLTNKPAGTYIVTATDANNISRNDTLILTQPDPLSFQSTLSDFNGYNVEATGGNRGSIQLSALGGTPAYRYLWSNGDNALTRSGLTAGTYTFTITDANQCTTNGSITLNEPSPIQVSFSNIENPNCFKSTDGKATINISGGQGDFSVVWDNGSFSLSPDDLPSGYNAVRIYEGRNAVLDTGITLTAPADLDIQFIYSQYSGFNVSCIDCFNGTVATTVTGGTTPYTYQWEDANSSTTANLNNLNGGDITLNITDANGCKTSKIAQLTMPTPKDWSRYGNANIDTAQFIGSTDTSAVVFKSNNQKSLILNPNLITLKSALKLENVPNADSTETLKMVGLSSDGTIKSFGNADYDFRPADNQIWSCNINGGIMPWQHPTLWNTTTNQVVGPEVSTEIITCPDLNVGVGVIRVASNVKFHVKGKVKFDDDLFSVNPNNYGRVGIGTSQPIGRLDVRNSNNNTALLITSTGLVGIGTNAPLEPLHVQGKTCLNGDVHIGENLNSENKLVVEGKVYAREFHVNLINNWPDYVFGKKYHLTPLLEVEQYIKKHGHLSEIPSQHDIETNGIAITELLILQMKKIEELTLYIIELQKQQETLKQQVNNLKK